MKTKPADRLLRAMVERGASDLHLTTSLKPRLRVCGDIVTMEEEEPLSPEQSADLVQAIMPDAIRDEFDRDWDTDFAYELPGTGRFRVNAFRDRHGVGGVFRLIPTTVPSLDQLRVPSIVRDFCQLSKGLVVVTGPTGSGKSTTLAAMIDEINHRRAAHVVTIEDPIEFVHVPVKCLVNQREVHSHTKSFAAALRAALREDPDIVLVGEMRDLDTIETAIETAETGHLVFGTLHTNTAASTVNRIIDMFPGDRQNQIRSMLADSLRGVIAQTLCKRIGGGRVAAVETLVINTAIASQIREGKTHMIASAMQTGKASGMQAFVDDLMALVLSSIITPEEAFVRALDKQEIRSKLTQAGFQLTVDEQEMQKKAPDRTAEFRAIVKQCQDTLKSNPDNLDALIALAWIEATSPSDSLRNGRDAVRLAEKANALTKGGEPEVLQALGAAYAENGHCDRAAEVARKAIGIASAARNNALIASLNTQLRLYEQGQAYRDTAG
jgi:twitching motility protein PilT